MKYILVLVLFIHSLFAYSDADMDGVNDTIDRCLNTPIMNLVDKNGCSTKSLISPHHFDIIIGSSYSTYNSSNTYTTSLQLDYFYKEFSLSLSSSYFTNASSSTNNDNNGMSDSYFGISYRVQPITNFSLSSSIGTLISTYNSTTNKDDYTASLNAIYYIDKFRFLTSYKYTFIGDTSTSTSFQNTNAYNIGVGYYFTHKLYISSSYKKSKSVYTNNVDIESISLYSSYSFNTHWFSTLSYSYGLSASANDNYLSLRGGYYF